jgi:hypothetical protein
VARDVGVQAEALIPPSPSVRPAAYNINAILLYFNDGAVILRMCLCADAAACAKFTFLEFEAEVSYEFV